MTRSRYRIWEKEQAYFMTCTIVSWLPVFTRPETVNIVFDSWRFLQRERGFQLFGYVILENHLHLIASSSDLSKDMKDFKSFTARQIIELLRERGVIMLLEQLELFKARHKTESTYQVWEEGNHPEQIQGEEMMLQKLEYIHNNPVKRGYVDVPEHWRYSSVRNYLGMPGLAEVVTQW
jgi:REP element-mobilizing transposase RayT